jgi:tetratricopeptide (TPR) repeat protein
MINDLELMGTLQLEFGNVNKAEDMFRKAADIIEASSLEPTLKQREKADQLYSIGRVYIERGQLDLARKNAQSYMKEAEALQDKARIRTAHELAGRIALKAGDHDGAIAELNQANLANPGTHYRLAMAYQGKGNTQKAKECCEMAANYHAVNSLQYALVRQKAKQMAKSL